MLNQFLESEVSISCDEALFHYSSKLKQVSDLYSQMNKNPSLFSMRDTGKVKKK